MSAPHQRIRNIHFLFLFFFHRRWLILRYVTSTLSGVKVEGMWTLLEQTARPDIGHDTTTTSKNRRDDDKLIFTKKNLWLTWDVAWLQHVVNQLRQGRCTTKELGLQVLELLVNKMLTYRRETALQGAL